MDDTYLINVAKTEFREGYNRGDVDRILSVFDEEGFTDMSEGVPSSTTRRRRRNFANVQGNCLRNTR